MNKPYWLFKCKNCGWFNDGICEFQTHREFGSICQVENDSYCQDWVSMKKEGRQFNKESEENK